MAASRVRWISLTAEGAGAVTLGSFIQGRVSAYRDTPDLEGHRKRLREALGKKDTVEHVDVHAGGQAVVGIVESPNCPYTSASGVERGQEAGAGAGRRRCRTAAAECTAGCPRAPRRVTRMPSSTDTMRLKQSRAGARVRSCCGMRGLL